MKFKNLAAYFQKLEATAKRLEMSAILAELFKQVGEKKTPEIGRIVYLCQGQLLPSFKNIEFGISEKIIHRALVEATGASSADIDALVQRTGDYGAVAQELCRKHAREPEVMDVYEDLEKLAAFSGEGSVGKKITFVAEMLKNVSAVEAKYIVRIILGKLRMGIGDPTVLDGLSLAYGNDNSLRAPLERAYNLCSDLGLVADILFNKGMRAIEDFKVIVGCPIRMALAARLSGPQEIIEKVGTCAVEAKYDGFRCQVHKKGDQVHIFSRNLENTTAMFPEIREGTLRQIKAKNVIFEGEAIAFDPDTGENLPFQTTVQRKRKHDIEMMQSRFPLKLFVFDILYSGEDLTPQPYRQRRAVLAGVIEPGEVLEISPVVIADTAEQVEKLFLRALDEGREGIVAKRIDGEYQAGGRNFNWIKLKRSTSAVLQDTIDCVIAGYFFGKGTRSAFGIGSLLACVYDKQNDRFKTIAKLGSGISEDELSRFKAKLDMTKTAARPERVDSLITPDVWVEPKFVVEVQADEITKSPVHTCGKTGELPGFALRFPRTVGFVRLDKNAEDATTVDEIVTMFTMQGRRK